jgi:hypothetical protein
VFCNTPTFMPFGGIDFTPDLLVMLGGQQPITPTLQSAADTVVAASGCGAADCSMVPLAITSANVGLTGAPTDSVAPVFTGF